LQMDIFWRKLVSCILLVTNTQDYYEILRLQIERILNLSKISKYWHHLPMGCISLTLRPSVRHQSVFPPVCRSVCLKSDKIPQ
jgi:hypothetical protein